jgi:predicted peptidase
MNYFRSIAFLLLLQAAAIAQSEPRLLREPYFSEITGGERDYFVYLPRGFSSRKEWPVLLYLHGNGERGDGKEELDFLLVHGPLNEAWIQKRDLPFVIVAPQLPMYEMGDVPYIKNRRLEDIPRRQAEGTPARPDKFPSDHPMGSHPGEPEDLPIEGPPSGWNLHATELIGMVDTVIEKYRGDPRRVYLTGLSYGGFGVWWMASRYPERFAAANPVVGYAHPDLIDPIAKAAIPVWCFAGGRDSVVPVRNFYAGMNKLEQLSPAEVRFTVEEDMNHDVWSRVYAGEDIYRWLLSHSK